MVRGTGVLFLSASPMFLGRGKHGLYLLVPGHYLCLFEPGPTQLVPLCKTWQWLDDLLVTAQTLGRFEMKRRREAENPGQENIRLLRLSR
jgi:hypothetical protein